jgi:uncharacterized membrane protein
VGESLALLSACCFAAANVTVARGARGQDNGAFLSILMTAVVAGAAWIYDGLREGWPQVNAVGMLWFAAAGVLTIFIGRVFLFASVQHLGAVQASAVKRLNPFFSVLLGVLVLGEPFDSIMMIGMLLIFSSFGVLLKQSMAATNGSATSRSSGGESTVQSWAEKLRNLGFFLWPSVGTRIRHRLCCAQTGFDLAARSRVRHHAGFGGRCHFLCADRSIHRQLPACGAQRADDIQSVAVRGRSVELGGAASVFHGTESQQHFAGGADFVDGGVRHHFSDCGHIPLTRAVEPTGSAGSWPWGGRYRIHRVARRLKPAPAAMSCIRRTTVIRIP